MMFGTKEDLKTSYKELNESLDNVMELKSVLEKQNYKASDIKIESRILSHWISKDLLFSKIKKGSKSNYSFIDCVWLKCIEKMRMFGLDYKIIYAFKSNLIYRIESDELLKFIESDEFQILSDKLPGTKEQKNEIYRTLINTNHKDLNLDINLFETVIIDMLLHKQSYTFKINQIGDFIFIKEGKEIELVEKIEGFSDFLSSSYFNLSISEILTEVYWEEIDFTSVSKIKNCTLTESELKILEAIRDNQIIKIELNFDGNLPQRVILMKTTQLEKIEIGKRISDYLLKGRYAKLEVYQEDGRVVSCINTTRHKF